TKAIPGAININEALPLVPKDITAAWCSKVPGENVQSAVIAKEYHGFASKLIVNLTYEEGSAGPSSICVKGGFNPYLLAKMPMVKFVLWREAEFYYYVAPLVDLRLPKPYFCTTDTVNGQGIVVMEDLSADTEFGSPMKPWKVETVRSNVEQLAKLHAGTWNPDEVWGEYRKLVFHGFAWATVGKGLQTEEYIFAMAERHCMAIVDHGTLELLESLPGHGTY
ncbi:hypothetical protein PG996_014946, partial [Apiospora saccharicola]